MEQLAANDNVAIASLAAMVLFIGIGLRTLWVRLKEIEDRKTELAVEFTKSIHEQAATLRRAIDKLEGRRPSDE